MAVGQNANPKARGVAFNQLGEDWDRAIAGDSQSYPAEFSTAAETIGEDYRPRMIAIEEKNGRGS